MNAAELWQKIKPFAIRDLNVGTTGGGNTGTSVATHSLNGPAHTGSLARTQAPWVATDINTALNLHTADADAHHAKQHSITDGAVHTVVGSQWSVVGLSAANVLGVLASSSAPGATETLLRSATDGSVTLPLFKLPSSSSGTSFLAGNLTTDGAKAGSFNMLQLESRFDDIVIQAGVNDANPRSITLRSGDSKAGLTVHTDGSVRGITAFVSGFTGAGYRLDDGVATTGKTTLELDEMIVRGRMRVYELLIHQIRATNGSLFVSGGGKAKTVSGSGPYTITTDTDHGFAANDLIRAQRFTGSGVYQSNLQVTGVSSSTVFTATLSSGDAPSAGMEFVRLGNTSDTSRQGSIYLTADDTYAPYIDILDGVASFAHWGAFTKIKVRLGRLDGITDVTLNPSGYGLYSQNAYLKGTVSAANDVVRLDSSGVRVRAVTGSSYASLNAYRFLNAGDVEIGGVYGRDYSSAFSVALATTGDSTHTPATQITSRGGTAVGGSAQVYLDATSQNAAKSANILLDVSNSESSILFGAADYAQFNMVTLSIGGHRPLTDLGANLGSATYRWGVVYANQVIASTISGATMSGAEWEYTGSMIIDANSASATTVSITNQGSGTASLDVEANISLGGTVDGVDIALLKSSYDTHVTIYNNHVANVNAHHAQSHVLATTAGLGGDHSVTGLTTGQVLRATGATSAQFMALTSGDITTALTYTPANRSGDNFTGAVTITSNTEGAGSGNQTYQIGVGKSGAGFVQVGTHGGYPALSGQGSGSFFRLLLNPENGGNVGIGTLSPSYRLDVSGTGRFAGALIVQPASNVVSAFEVRDASNIPVFSVDTLNFRAGFGRNDPQAKFHIYTSADEILRLESSSATGSPFLSWFQANTRRSFVQHNDTNDNLIIASEYGDVSIRAAATAGTDSDTTYVTVKAGGNVGIGVVPTTYKFEVNGTARISGTAYLSTVTTAAGDLTLSAASGAITVSGASIGGASWNILSSGHASFDAAVYTPLVQQNGSDLTVTSVSHDLILNGTSNVDVRVSGVSQWTLSNTRILPRSSLVMDIGASNRRIRTIHAGELNVEILVAQSVMATIGGRIMVSPTNKLIADVALAATTIDVSYNNFVNGEYIYLSAAPGGVGQIEAMQVTSSATAITGGYRYSVSRNLDGTGANIWYAGDAVVSLRSAVGQGYIDLTSTNTIHNHYGPTQTFYVRTSTATWNSVAPVVSAGNLRSFVDYTGDEFGFATGNDLTLLPSAGFRGVTVDRTNGVRLFNTDIRLYNAGMQTLNINSTGTDIWVGTSSSNKRLHWDGATLNFNNSSGTAVITFDNSGASYFAGPMTIGSSGGIYQGSGTFASPTTGLKIWNDSGVGRIGGYNAGTLQCSIDTDGKFKSGDNRIEISASGGVRARITNNAYDGLLFINNDIVNYPPFYLAGLNAYSNNTLGEARSSWYASHINNQSYPVQIELRAANNANASIIIFKNALVGINQDTASYALDVNGSCHASSFPTSSDRRFKEALTPLSPVLDRLGRIGTYNFYWRRNYAGYEQFLDEGRPQLQVGFVAQEVEQEFPELISRWRHVGRDGVATDDAYSVDYARMVPILVQAIRELRAELTALKSM